MGNTGKNEKDYRNFILGMTLLWAGIFLIKTSFYTSAKGMVIDLGGSITLAVLVAISLVALCFTSGAFLIQRA